MSSNHTVEDIYPLSPLQQGMLFHSLYAPNSSVYFHQYICTLEGELDLPAFKKAWQRVVDRHTILRSAFEWEELDEPVQIVYRGVELPIESLDWRELAGTEQERRFESLLKTERKLGFELSHAPLMRLLLIRLSDGLYRFVWNRHHALLDGWSVPLILKEVFSFYESYREDREPAVVQDNHPYREYIAWLRRQDISEAEEFWRERLKGFSRSTRIWIDRGAGRLPGQEEVYEDVYLNLSSEATARLQRLAKQYRLTVNTVLQGAWGVLVGRYSGETDIVFGITVSGRPVDLRGVESTIGLFTNTLALRLHVSHERSTIAWLKLLQDQQIELQQYSYSPLTQVHEWSEIPRGEPLFETILVFQNFPYEPLSERPVSGLKIADILEYERNNLPLTVIGAPGEKLGLGIAYDRRRYDQDAIGRMLRHLAAVLEEIGLDPETRVDELPLLSRTEQQEILVEWNRIESKYEDRRCLHELIEDRLEAHPEAIAVIYNEQCVTYQELNRRANQLAHYLGEVGVGPESRVGICLDRSIEMIEAVLAVMKAGAAYVPLDPAYPPERVAQILEDAQPIALISEQRLLERLPAYWGISISLDVDRDLISGYSVENPVERVTIENLAYIIFTSGSTGRPSGVMTDHRSLVNRILSLMTAYGIDPSHRLLQFLSLNFDAAAEEIFPTLLGGASLVLHRNPIDLPSGDLLRECERFGVTTLHMPPAYLDQLSNGDLTAGRSDLSWVKLVITGGESFSLERPARWRLLAPTLPIVNAYGPTEATITSTVYEVPADVSTIDGPRAPIGRPIGNTQVYILDERLRLTPRGVAGELYIAGAGLARGYLGHPDLTAERFVPDPFSGEAGERTYRTGDICRYLQTGTIDLIGRKDNQIKLHGHRIELDEINTVLGGHPAVEESVVTLRESERGEKRLVAYVVARAESAITTEELRNHLKGSLPEYMIPTAFVTLEAMPLSPNGKIDRKALPDPAALGSASRETYVAPTNTAEEALAKIWSEVLGVDRIGVNDNFFVLGGDSIRGIQLVAKAQEHGFGFSLHELFESQTVKELAATAGEKIGAPPELSHHPPFRFILEEDRLRMPDDIVDAYPLTMLQAGMIFHSEYSPDLYHTIISLHLRIPVHLDALRQALESLIARHSVLRTSFDLVNFSQPLQLVHDKAPLPLTVEDLRQLTSAEQEGVIAEWIAAEKRRSFDWTDYPLIRFWVHLRGGDNVQFTFCGPHALFDGWSDSVFFTELFRLYFSALNGEVDPLEPLPPVTFGDYVALEQEALRSQECREYWRRKLSDLTIATLPFRPSSSGAPDLQAHTQIVPISAELSEGLRRLAELAGTSLKSVLLAAHLRVLCLLTGKTDVITGLVSHGRPEAPNGERIIGLFLNALPLRLRLKGGTWVDLARDTFAAEAEAMPFRRYPLAQIQRENNGQSIFSTAFTFTNFHIYESVRDFENAEVLNVTGFGKTDLPLGANFNLDSRSGHLGFSLSGDPVRICGELLEMIGGYYSRVFALMVNDPFARYEYANLLTPSEELELLVDWNGARSWSRDWRGIGSLFEDQAAARSEAIALICGELQISYGELNFRANNLAHYLRALGMQPESRVGIYLNRGVAMIVAVLGVLKAGIAYVPLDPEFPLERLGYMLEDAGVWVALTEQALLARLPSFWGQAVCLDAEWETISVYSGQNPALAATPENLAYIIYTSGSTGQPKGVMVDQLSLSNRALSLIESYRIDSSHRLFQFVSLVFDAAAEEIFPTLLSGASLVLHPSPTTMPLSDLLEECKGLDVTTWHLPPAYLNQGANGSSGFGKPALTRSKLLITGGESFGPELPEKWLRSASASRFVNAYGPTEATITSTIYEATAEIAALGGQRVPIGKPVGGTQVYILDDHFMPAPVGVAGELYISGEGLARGYMNRADLTASKFVPNPFSRELGARMYMTGDVCRYLQGGTIDLIGRKDDQVKLRGYRIELGEIESVLGRYPGVKQTVVLVSDEKEDHRQLVGFVVPVQPGELEISELQDFLRQKLPEYMVPAAFIELEAFPLTLNSKIDRQALLLDVSQRLVSDDDYVAPRDSVEEVIAGIWSQLLGADRIGVHDNFYRLGGHSLLATQLVSRIRDVLRVEVSLGELLEAPTVAEMSRVVQMVKSEAQRLRWPAITRVPRDEELPLSFAQQRLWFVDKLKPDNASYNCPLAIHLSGQLNIQFLERALNDVMARHETLRSTFSVSNGRPKLLISSEYRVDLAIENLCHLAEEERRTAVQGLVSREVKRPFDLSLGPLIRAKVLKLTPDEYVVTIVIPHILVDAWSMGVLVSELSTLYRAYGDGEPSPLPELEIQYVDYARWQRQCMQGELLDEQLEYWRKQLGGKLPVLKLTLDLDQPSPHRGGGGRERIALSEELTRQIRALSHREGVTLFMMLLTAFKALLYRYSGQEDIIVGTMIANRDSVEFERLIGLFLNALPLRTDLSGDPTFRELLARVRDVTLGAYTHQGLPFETMVDELQPERRADQTPLFRAFFDLQTAPRSAINLPGLTLSPVVLEDPTTKFDLRMSLAEDGQRLVGSIDYEAGLFDKTAMKKAPAHFRTLLESVVENPDQPLSSLRLLDDAESDGRSPSDFPDIQLSRKDFENILMEVGFTSTLETA